MKKPPPDDEDQTKNLVVLVVVILLVGGSVWLLLKFRESSAMLDCAASGRKNCNPIEMPPP